MAWSSGDLNGDGTVNFDDFVSQNNNWQRSIALASDAAAVPEPATMLLASFSALGLCFALRNWRAVISLVMVTVFWAPQSLSAQSGWTFADPTPLPAPINNEFGNSDPTISSDGLTLIWASTRPGGNLWMSQRASRESPWGNATPLPATINSAGSFERMPHLSPNGLELYFGRGSGVTNWDSYDIWVAKRDSLVAPWNAPKPLASGINSAWEDGWPSLSADGLVLYFETNRRNPSSSTILDIFIARRESLDEPFEAATPYIVGHDLGSPEISRDGLSLFSSRCTNSDCDIMVSRRSRTSELFGAPVRVNVPPNSNYFDYEPELSDDGATVYFTSNRPGVPSVWGIWEAQVLSSPGVICDFNGDGICDTDDIDALTRIGNLETGLTPGESGFDVAFDVNGDNVVSQQDIVAWLGVAASENGYAEPYLLGDTNLDGTVNFDDFVNLNNHWQATIQLDGQPVAWSSGDLNGDGIVDFDDFVTQNNNWQQSIALASGAAAVPEPRAACLALTLLLGLWTTRGCRRNNNTR